MAKGVLGISGRERPMFVAKRPQPGWTPETGKARVSTCPERAGQWVHRKLGLLTKSDE